MKGASEAVGLRSGCGDQSFRLDVAAQRAEVSAHQREKVRRAAVQLLWWDVVRLGAVQVHPVRAGVNDRCLTATVKIRLQRPDP